MHLVFACVQSDATIVVGSWSLLCPLLYVCCVPCYTCDVARELFSSWVIFRNGWVLGCKHPVNRTGPPLEVWHIQNFIYNFFTRRVTMLGRRHVLFWLTEFSGVVLSCFTSSCWTIFTEVLPIAPEDSPIQLFKAIVYSKSLVRKLVSTSKMKSLYPFEQCLITKRQIED